MTTTKQINGFRWINAVGILLNVKCESLITVSINYVLGYFLLYSQGDTDIVGKRRAAKSAVRPLFAQKPLK